MKEEIQQMKLLKGFTFSIFGGGFFMVVHLLSQPQKEKEK